MAGTETSGRLRPPLAESFGKRVDRLAQAEDVAADRYEREPHREPRGRVLLDRREDADRLADRRAPDGTRLR